MYHRAWRDQPIISEENATIAAKASPTYRSRSLEPT
jgi:hypothetical protein